MKTLGALVVSASVLAIVGVSAQTTAKISDDVVKIGLILDMSSLYSDITGIGSVAAAQLAIDDFGGKIAGKPIQLVHADHQNKPDLAANTAREWFDHELVRGKRDTGETSYRIADPVRQTRSLRLRCVSRHSGSTRPSSGSCRVVRHCTVDRQLRSSDAACARDVGVEARHI